MIFTGIRAGHDRQFRSSGTLQPVHQEMPNCFSATEVRPLRKRGRPITTFEQFSDSGPEMAVCGLK